MQQQMIETLLAPGPQGQFPKLELVYGRCTGVLGVSPDWTLLKIADDTGEITVYIKSSLISVSDSLADECMLLVNDSGNSNVGQAGNAACIIINDAKDLWLRKPAYNEFRSRTGKDEARQAADQQTQQAATAVSQAAATVSESAVAAVPATAPVASAAPPIAQIVQLNPDAPKPAHLPPPFNLYASAMLDCMESATWTIGRFVERHPEFHAMLNEGAIRSVASTLFIQSVGKDGYR